jgi:hypothetical protein
MAELAVGFGFLQLWRIIRFNGMGTFIINLNDLFMGKVFVGKRRLDMADIGAVDLLCYRVMGQFVNIGVTVPAGDITMNGFAVDMFIHVIIYSSSVFIDSAQKAVSVTQEAVILVRRLCREADKQENEQYGDIQANFYIII